MKNIKTSYLLPVFLIFQTLLLAQDSGAGIPIPNGVVLIKQKVVEERPLDYDAWLQTIDPTTLSHNEVLYLPTQYDTDGNPTAYDYVTIKVKDDPQPPKNYVTSDVLMALITLPKSETFNIGRLFLKLGETSTSYNLLDTAYQPSESSSPYEVIKAEEYTVIAINLGTSLVGKPSYYGQVVFQSTEGTMSSPYYFTANP